MIDENKIENISDTSSKENNYEENYDKMENNDIGRS